MPPRDTHPTVTVPSTESVIGDSLKSVAEGNRALISFTDIPGKGRGVVADEDIAAGTVIEVAPIITIPIFDKDPYDPPHAFGWDWERSAIVLGLTSLCNEDNDYNPNCYYIFNDRDMVSTLVSLRAIGRGEEITIAYNCRREWMSNCAARK